MFSFKPLQQSNVKLKTYSGEPLPVHGSITVEVCEGTQKMSLNLLVVGDRGPSLLGRDWMHCLRLNWNSILHLQVHSLNNLLQKHSDVFKDELGTLKDFEAKIYIEPGANPRFCKARPVPYAYRSKVEAELDRLIEQNIIEPIPFSDWAAPIVPVLKADNTIRICGDYKVTVNQVSKLDRYPIPKIEDLFAKLSGGTVFTKLDLSQAYQQLMLDEESKKYIVINTHRGLFRYNRLPFGISSAPGIFQRTMESLLQGIPKVVVYLDDILVTGLSEEDHLLTLQKVLQRIESSGLRLKKNKCKFMVPSVSYLGYKIDAQGLHPLPEKMDAIMKAPSPTSLTELKSFLGLLSYYGKFIPNMSTVVHPLYDLLKKSTKWKWTEDEEQAFKLAKEQLTSNSVLIHFDPGKEVLLSCDASAYGIGAVLSHRLPDGTERPIGFSSRTLSAAEQKYSQIEKETLACVFGVKRFHSYLFGHRFTLITDHKPLLTLINAHRAIPTHTSNRIQRWALTLSMYEYSISFKSTAAHGNADALSRLPLPETSKDPPVPAETVLLLEQLSESPISVKQIKLWTRRDPTLSRVLQFTLYGWPDKPPEDPAFKPYWTRKLELSTQDGVLLWGNRVVVPIPGRLPILDELHSCHPGVSRMKTLSRMFVWWPALDSDVEEKVKSCSICQSNRPAPPAAPLHPWSWPTTPWTRLHLDLAGPFLGHMFFILVDAHSKWIEVEQMTSTTSSAIISTLRNIFSRFGLPNVIVTDNGRNFVSAEFESFLKRNGIQHLTSAPLPSIVKWSS